LRSDLGVDQLLGDDLAIKHLENLVGVKLQIDVVSYHNQGYFIMHV
jgi:hypothetical protein